MRENIYTVEFFSKCPVNNIRIHYTLTIKTENMVVVEDLLNAVNSVDKGFHEKIADDLFKIFGGYQTLEAEHHGVYIKTQRS